MQPGFLIAARCMQGIGAALMIPESLALITAAYRRARARPRHRHLGGGLRNHDGGRARSWAAGSRRSSLGAGLLDKYSACRRRPVPGSSRAFPRAAAEDVAGKPDFLGSAPDHRGARPHRRGADGDAAPARKRASLPLAISVLRSSPLRLRRASQLRAGRAVTPLCVAQVPDRERLCVSSSMRHSGESYFSYPSSCSILCSIRRWRPASRSCRRSHLLQWVPRFQERLRRALASGFRWLRERS